MSNGMSPPGSSGVSRLLLILLCVGKLIWSFEVHVAPMVGYSNRHFRYLMRLLKSDAVLWSEMIKPAEVLQATIGRRAELLSRGQEHGMGPCIAQFGSDDADELRQCCRLAAQFGYDQVSLNIGCPSVETNAHFGASLMRDPARVAMLLDSMADSSLALPVSIKCRIGIRERYQDVREDRLETLVDFVRTVTRSGAVRLVVVHARSAVLQGLDPEKNRSVPPLRYDFVEALAREFPDVSIILNGGITSVNASMLAPDSPLGGVMLGRAFLRRPLDILKTTVPASPGSPDAIADGTILQYARYAAREMATAPASAIQVLLPLTLVFMSLHNRDGGEEPEQQQPGPNATDDRRLKLVMQVMTPLLRQASASASVLSSLRDIEADLDEMGGYDRGDGGGGHDEDEDAAIGRAANRLAKLLKNFLGKKLVGKVRANCAI